MNDADEQDLDVATAVRDAALLDTLGRGDPPPVDDEVATLLAAWRADLTADLPTGDLPAVRPAVPAAAPVRRFGRPRATAWRRPVAAAAAVLVAIAGGLVVGAANAGPNSPLWPITRLVYQERADSRLAQQRAERTIAQARQAVTEQRYTDAAGLLDQANDLIDQVRDARVAQRLRDEVGALRALLALGAVVGPSPTGPAGSATPPGGPAPSGRATPGPSGSPGAPGTPGLPLPGVSVPGLPLPSAPLPSGLLPTDPLELPDLPLL